MLMGAMATKPVRPSDMVSVVFRPQGIAFWKPGLQLVDVAAGMDVDDPDEDVGDIRERIDDTVAAAAVVANAAGSAVAIAGGGATRIEIWWSIQMPQPRLIFVRSGRLELHGFCPGAHVLHIEFGRFHRGKVAAMRHIGPILQIIALLDEAARWSG
jgi:hypothetical protein